MIINLCFVNYKKPSLLRYIQLSLNQPGYIPSCMLYLEVYKTDVVNYLQSGVKSSIYGHMVCVVYSGFSKTGNEYLLIPGLLQMLINEKVKIRNFVLLFIYF